MAPMHEHMCRRAVLLLALARAASCALTGLQLTRQGCVCISDCSANTVADPWCWVMGPDGGYARRQDQGSCGDWYEGRGDRESGWFDRCEVKQVAPYEPHGVLGDQAYPAPFILLQQDLPFHINIASIPYCLHGEDGDCHDSWHAVPREPWVRYATSWQCVACKQLVSVTWHREFCAPYADMTILTVYDRRRNMVVMSFQGTVDQTHLQISLQMRKEFPYRQLGPAWQKAGWHAGTYWTFQELQGSVYQILDELHADVLYKLPAARAPRFMVTGHSLGGAVAMIAALDIASMYDTQFSASGDASCANHQPCQSQMPLKQGGERRPAWRLRRPAVLAFAPPRVMTEELGVLYAKLVPEHYTFFNAEDGIVNMPPEVAGFRGPPGMYVKMAENTYNTRPERLERGVHFIACPKDEKAWGEEQAHCRPSVSPRDMFNLAMDTDKHCMMFGKSLCGHTGAPLSQCELAEGEVEVPPSGNHKDGH